MLFNIGLGYSVREKFDQLSDKEYSGLRELIMSLPKEKEFWMLNDLICDIEAIQKLVELGLEPQIKQIKNTYSPEKPKDHWANHIEEAKSAVHVHVPNIGLLMINEVMVLENICTDELQRHLDKGWRIIAVCPPNGVRRPDYVLGRSKNKEDKE
jgi:hypothetical protein